MAIPVEMPKLGNTVEDCLLAKWIKSKGDTVAAGEIVAEIETDKATFEVPAPAAGVLLATFFDEGALVPVFTNICVIGEPGEDPAPFRPGSVVAPPRVARAEVAIEAPQVETPRTPAAEPAPVPLPPAAGTFASPRARRFAEEHRMDVGGIAGSGPGGRVLEQDVRDAFYTKPRPAVVAVPAPASAVESAPVKSTAMGGIRDKIARRMREALSTTAQYTLTTSADASALLALRSRIKASRGELPDANLNDLVLYCTVKALERMPQLNAELKDGKLQQYAHINLGFACDTDRGLMVPVIRNAQAMNLAQLAAAAKDLAERAVKGRILPDELSGGTFTVSNLGSLGIESFTPIINVPQVAILGVNAIEPRMVRKDGKLEIQDRIGLSLTCDHQVIDGAPGARFLKIVRECIEEAETLCSAGFPRK